ncbi:MAG: class I SAM-dependent methyltransferase [Bacteriovoracaceae bacterium]|jgi:predicted TPR repeat methyltransferase|nr:class I SAM-dependent methyltransferase [Bacteriovoracaceae bacterium]
MSHNSPKDVGLDYQESFSEKDEHKKVKWGSREGMLNRFKLGIEKVNWSDTNSWVDVGCGTGSFIDLVLNASHCQNIVGIDVCVDLAEFCREKFLDDKRVEILTGNFETDLIDQKFDLVTSIGVLQNCGLNIDTALTGLVSLLGQGGTIFFTTKNQNWNKFTSGELTPEDAHLWFDPNIILEKLRNCGVEVEEIGGFLPRENRVVEINDSHTFYILGKLK